MNEDFVPYEKLNKKEKKERDKVKRVRATFNTGTRIHDDAKHPSRAKEKREYLKEQEE